MNCQLKRFSQLLSQQHLLLLLLCTSILSSALVSAEEGHGRQRYALTHQSSPAIIDGELTESLWQQATQIELPFENYPAEGEASPVQTQGYLFEDGDSLYVAIVAHDPIPADIRGFLSDRDNIANDDYVGLVIDTFNDERFGYEFYVNPKGVQFDGRMNDTQGGNTDDSWNAIWYSAATVNDSGWVVEMRIPLSALRFDDNSKNKVWNFALVRHYPRELARTLASYQENNRLDCNLCQYDKLVGFANTKTKQTIQLTPTATFSQHDVKNLASKQWQKGDVKQEAGLDLRWGISQNSVLNATINPDFSQVEADASQLNVNNTYSLYFAEKRSFFVDGADYFKTNNFDFVHTRNIADPDYGVKLTGKDGQHSYGLLLANDNQTAFLMPGNQSSALFNYRKNSDVHNQDQPIDSQIAIARYKADVGERNNLGFLATVRKADGYDNHLASVDGSYWLDDERSVQYQLAYSDTTNPNSVQQRFALDANQRDHAIALNYYHNTRDFRFNFGFEDVGEDFRADMGFNRQVDYKALTLGGERTYYGEKEALLTRYGYFGNLNASDSQLGDNLTRNANFYGFINAPLQFFAKLGVEGGKERYQSGFVGIAEQFNYYRLAGFATITPYSGFTFKLSFNWGEQIDYANAQVGRQFDYWATANWQVNTHLSANLNHKYNTFAVDGYSFSDNGQLFTLASGNLYTSNNTDLRLAYQFNIQSQLKLTVQYTDVSRDLAVYRNNLDDNEFNDYQSLSRNFSTQFLYSYKVNPQTLVYLGYSDGGFQQDDMISLSRNQRTVFAKFSYAWQG